MTKKTKAPLSLIILDGWGVGPRDKSINAIEAAKTPFFDMVCNKFPYAELGASGEDVGLENNQMSGSEAGHLNIGAGRIVKQDVRFILEEISQGSFFHNPALLSTVSKVKAQGANLHLMGMMGNADSPHSHPDIFLALLILLKKHQLEGRVFIHLFSDGRDSFPKSALDHLAHWKEMIHKIGIGEIASLTGRFYAMDRAKNWDRLMLAFDALVYGKGACYESPEQAVEANYKKGNTDEYIEPSVMVKAKKPVGLIRDNDGIIFFNLRSDRARQFTKLFVGTKRDTSNVMPTISGPRNLSFVAMTDFGPDLNLQTVFASRPVIKALPETLSGITQVYMAETEKFAHVTYFINGGFSEPLNGEERIMIPSPVIRSYANQPEMAAGKITETLCKHLRQDDFEFYTVNFANADMVGHTGQFEATVKAVEFVDLQLQKVYQEISKKQGTMIITADHGNADIMIDTETDQPFTFHTKNPVPFVVVGTGGQKNKIRLRSGGILGDVAPTVLELLGNRKPEEMTCDSLIQH